jgi:hypothetical protein
MEFDLLCISCKHFIKDKNTCPAFSNGIPQEIWNGLNDHNEPLPEQDNEIVYEPVNES